MIHDNDDNHSDEKSKDKEIIRWTTGLMGGWGGGEGGQGKKDEPGRREKTTSKGEKHCSESSVETHQWHRRPMASRRQNRKHTDSHRLGKWWRFQTAPLRRHRGGAILKCSFRTFTLMKWSYVFCKLPPKNTPRRNNPKLFIQNTYTYKVILWVLQTVPPHPTP